MKIKKVCAVYFSPTGTTKKTVELLGKILSEQLRSSYEAIDFTLPANRQTALLFQKGEVVVFGVPVIAGRVPNVLLKFLETIQGEGAFAVPIVLYGNRNYDDALIELKDILERSGMITIGAGAFVGEHSFSDTLAKGRPDQIDVGEIKNFALALSTKIKENHIVDTSVEVKGTPYPYRGYYQPRDRQGNPVDIRKVKPLTNDNCTDCKICAKVCPMGSINIDEVSKITGICIKCGACIKKCPEKSKYYEDERYLYHKHELEEELKRRAGNEIFL